MTSMIERARGALLATTVGIAGCGEQVPPPASLDLAAIPLKDLTAEFHRRWYDSQTTWKENRWLGVPTLQNPFDVWIIQEIIHQVRPELIIETGAYNGGSVALWAMLLAQVEPEGKVISVDPKDHPAAAAKIPITAERVEFVVSPSVDPAVIDDLRARAAGKRVLVILDSEHVKANVLEELREYGSMVSVGSYMIVQDSNINGHPVMSSFGEGPFEAIDEFLSEADTFEVDTSRERMMLTFNPRGYLKRVR